MSKEMITYLKSETERLEKRIKKINPYVDFYGQIPTLTKSNSGEFFEYLKLNQELSTLIKTSWIFAKRIIDNWELYPVEYNEELKEIISYCEAKAKQHKIDLEEEK